MNLISNALKFSEENSSIDIYFTLYRKDGKSYFEVQIKDRGMGIKEEDKGSLFKLFGFVKTTQDVNTRGIGLGLSISQKIVKKFGGQIGFISEWEKGSTFAFCFEVES